MATTPPLSPVLAAPRQRPWLPWVAGGAAVAFVILAWVVHQRWLESADQAGLAAVQGAAPSWLDLVASLIDVLGRAEVTIPLVIAWAIWQAWRGHPRRGIAIAAGFILVTLVNPLAKEVISQPPPDPSLARYSFGFVFPTAQADLSGAFPSGHASRVAYLLVVLALGLGSTRWWWLVGVLVIVIAGLSRVVLGAHWISDVGGGVLLGSFMGLLADALSWGPEDPVSADAAPPRPSTPG